MHRRGSCPACGSRRQKIICEWAYSDPGVLQFLCDYYDRAAPDTVSRLVGDGRFAVVECADCALLYQRDVPDEDFLGEIYERWIIEDDYLAPTAEAQPPSFYDYMASEIMHLLAEQRRIIGPGRRISVLDFGMGWSNWLQVARAFGASVFGAELSVPKIKHAESIGIPVLSLEQIAGMRFDIIATEQVFEHVTQPAILLEALVPALAETGFFKISVPDGRRVRNVLSSWRWDTAMAQREALMPIHPLEHINCFIRPVLDRFAARHGLKPARLSIARAIGNSAGWASPRAIVKNLLRPVYRFGLRRGTYAIYSHA
jgi:Methyltransferase domain